MNINSSTYIDGCVCVRVCVPLVVDIKAEHSDGGQPHDEMLLGVLKKAERIKIWDRCVPTLS